jgi:asparagine synthase (glutamine-hydrolysing)
MCGIAGVIFKRPESKEEARKEVELLADAIKHRGPDDQGFHIELDNSVAFVNQRLAIVDIAGGHQPIYSEDGKVGIVFNGEIYNYRELKEDLRRAGYVFQTNSDTEVILRCYERFGVESFNKLNGMFAFCIWDSRAEAVYLVRDHVGIKPLYVYEDDDKIVFCSELKGIAALPDVELTPDAIGVQDYLMFRYVQAPYSLFKKVRCLEAGTYARIRKGVLTHFRYWDITYPSVSQTGEDGRLAEMLRTLLQSAVSSQLIGEVPIGVLLSGGVDSSGIATLVKQAGADLTTFSIGFPDLNEFEYSRAVAAGLGLKHVEVTTTPEELASLLDRVIMALDHPIADPACFPLYRLAEELKEHVTVVLSGEGGDELFGGYPQYQFLNKASLPYNKRFPAFMEKSWYFCDYQELMKDLTTPAVAERHKKYFYELPLLNGMLAYDMKTWLPENLMMKADKILMAHSLEGRFPFLDKGLIEFASRLPQTHKISAEGVSKWILKEMLKKDLPDGIINRAKMGFSVPVALLLKSWKETVFDAINSLVGTDLVQVLDVNKVKMLVNNYYSKATGEPLRVWTLFVLAYWFQHALPAYRSRKYQLPGRA